MAMVNSIPCFCFVVVMAVITTAAADTHTVGDSLGWTVPPGGPIAYETWARRQDFQFGDTIVFNWSSTHDVAEVSKADYDNCTKTNPIGTIHQTSPVNFTLDSNSTRYFICTVTSHCELGQKVTVSIGSNSASSLTTGFFSAFLYTTLLIYFLSM